VFIRSFCKEDHGVKRVLSANSFINTTLPFWVGFQVLVYTSIRLLSVPLNRLQHNQINSFIYTVIAHVPK
jgi:hypothetical protein